MQRVLVLGATGMLGSAVFRELRADANIDVYGTSRTRIDTSSHNYENGNRFISGVDVLNADELLKVFMLVRPNVAINCVGLVKQLKESNDPLSALPINSLLPHRLAQICRVAESRLIHISTDCVFSGKKGGYVESDFSDACDLYGRSKYLGEVGDQDHVITLRSSIIGHESRSCRGLVEWFLSQTESVNGYSQAFFSGFPTIELARIIKNYIIPNPLLKGLYHVASNPISKLELLRLIARQYGKDTKIVPEDTVVIDRTLNGYRFQEATGYKPPDWKKLIEIMHANQ